MSKATPYPAKTATGASERRKGETALSEFAEYVEQQQQKRRNPGADTMAAAATASSSAGPGAGSVKTRSTAIGTSHTPKVQVAGESTASQPPLITQLRPLLVDFADDDEEKMKRLREEISDRLEEGRGETIFELGEEADGTSLKMSKDQWDIAFHRIKKAASLVTANCMVLMTRNVGGPEEVGPGEKNEEHSVGHIMIRRNPGSVENVIELRIAVVGNVDAGKSTMLGVLVKGSLDDGRGKARVELFRHKHEIESGRTSSVGMEIMGFDSHGAIVTSSVPGRKLSWEEIGTRSAKVISFSDLAGHEKYLRTTVFGLLSSSPNYCLLMVAANNGIIGMSKEHLGIALALNVPVLVVITKIDICPPQILAQTISQLQKILRSAGARKVPFLISSREDCVQLASSFIAQRICPIFQVSNVTGQSLDLVRLLLNILPQHDTYDPTAPFEFQINDTFSVPNVGTVVSGIVKAGSIRQDDTVIIGPDSLGKWMPTKIRSIERKRIRVPTTSAGQSASFAIRRLRRQDVRKGMVVLPAPSASGPASSASTGATQPRVFREFVAEVLILSHATTIKPKYQAMLHVGPVSQTCAIIDIDRDYIRTGDRATVAFRFVQRPEYLAVGDRLLFREGRTKGLGIVKRTEYDPARPLRESRPVDDGGGGGGGGGGTAPGSGRA